MSLVSGTVKSWYTIRNTRSETSGELKSSIKGPGSTVSTLFDSHDSFTKSGILDNSKDYTFIKHKKQAQRRVWFNKALYGIFAFFCLLSVALYGAGLSTCTNPRSHCLPQFTFRMNNNTSAANWTLEAVEEVSKLITYMASEYSDAENSNENSITANTSVALNLKELYRSRCFELSSMGYCKRDLVTGSKSSGSRVCVGSIINGSDLAATSIRDFGFELAQLTGTVAGARSFSDASLSGYEISLPNLVKFFGTKVENKTSQEFNFQLFRKLIVLQNISKAVTVFVWCAIMVNTLVLVQLVVTHFCKNTRIRGKPWSSKMLALNKTSYKKCSKILTSVLTVLSTFSLVAISVIVGKMTQSFSSHLNMAQISLGMGFYVFILGSFSASFAQFVIAFLL